MRLDKLEHRTILSINIKKETHSKLLGGIIVQYNFITICNTHDY